MGDGTTREGTGDGGIPLDDFDDGVMRWNGKG